MECKKNIIVDIRTSSSLFLNQLKEKTEIRKEASEATTHQSKDSTSDDRLQ